MTRREIFIFLAGAALIGPAAAVAQPESIRTIGVLIGISETDPEAPRRAAALRQGLQELGWVDGQNIRVLYRWASEPDRIQALAQQLVELKPDVIIASSSLVVAALLRESRTTPIVFVTASDPIGDGFVVSLDRPGGKATGFTNNLASMGGKWIELLRDVVPGFARAAVLFNPETAPGSGSYFLRPIEAAAASLSVKTLAAPVRDPAQVETALADIGREPGGGVIVLPDNFTAVHRAAIISLAARYRVPAVYPFRYFATDGGLISYGADLMDLYRRSPTYVDHILRGANPADLPVEAPRKIELVINLKAAKSLGLTVPRIVLARADEVIE
jgi:putative ABC transport system substrate-binding protein